MARTLTAGQAALREIIPEDLISGDLVLDKKGLNSLLSRLALTHPDQYREVTYRLNRLGDRWAYLSGGASFGLEHLRRSKIATRIRQKLQTELNKILSNKALSDEQREKEIIKLAGKYMDEQREKIYEESLAEKNPLADQIRAGVRGNKMNLTSLRGSDLLYVDHRDNVIPVPVMRSYSEGLRPAEYWAGAYGARKGVYDTKMATQRAGYFGKQLNQAAHRLLIVSKDEDDDPDRPSDEEISQASQFVRGLPVDVDDEDNEGALLAAPVGGYPRNQLLTPAILGDLKKKGVKRILVRSPAVGGSRSGGVYARDVGVHEHGRLPVVGEFVGSTSAQALSEPFLQGQLSSKHSGGVAGAANQVSGFDWINSQISAPKSIHGGAAHAEVDGKVDSVEPAPAGGHFVTIAGKRHHVPSDAKVLVTSGQEVEAGDVLSTGIPNPSIVVQHKGIGEGRRYFTYAFRDAFRGSGMKANRRNIELLSRGLINHVQIDEEMDGLDAVPDDIIPYTAIERVWKPRVGAQTLSPSSAKGKYLELPVLHYSIGTPIRPSVIKQLEQFGIKDVMAHDDPPPFRPQMVKAMYNLRYDPDWMTRMLGSGLKSSLLDAVHRGAASDENSTSFVPSLAKAVNFGSGPYIKTPKEDPLDPPRGSLLG